MSDETKLRACWLCGDDISPRVVPVRDGYKVRCRVCMACGPEKYHGPDGMPSAGKRAAAAWNTRADDDLVTALVEALEPFGALADEIENCAANSPYNDVRQWSTNCGWDNLAAARAAIARAKQARGGGA